MKPAIEARLCAAALRLAAKQDWGRLTLEQIATAAKIAPAQAKKKARLKRRTAERKTVATGVKKPAARKMAAAPTSVSSGPATTPTGTAPAN